MVVTKHLLSKTVNRLLLSITFITTFANDLFCKLSLTEIITFMNSFIMLMKLNLEKGTY